MPKAKAPKLFIEQGGGLSSMPQSVFLIVRTSERGIPMFANPGGSFHVSFFVGDGRLFLRLRASMI